MPQQPTQHIGNRGRRRTNVGPAVEAAKHYAAERAIDDPVKLARAARIVRLALERRRLTIDELTPATTVDGASKSRRRKAARA